MPYLLSLSVQEHVEHLNAVFKRLQEAGLKLRLAKYHFAKSEVHYLGHIISSSGIAPDPAKCSAVKDYPVPTSAQQFLGLTNYS